MRYLPRFALACLAAVFTAGAFGYDLPDAGGSPHINFEADRADYNRAADSIKLSGHVKLKEVGRPDELPGRELFGEEFTVYPSSTVAVSSGGVLVKEGENAFYGEDGVFDWAVKSATLNYVSASYGAWRVMDSEMMSLSSGTEQKYRKVRITSCNLKDPHYYIKLNRLSVIPGRRVYGTGAVLYIDNVPVFYMPVFYKPLGTENPYVTYVAMGYDKRSGGSLKTTTVYKFNPRFTGKLFLDYFTNLGIGTGSELGYKDPARFNGSVAGYYIRENGTANKRWGLTGGYWWKLRDTLSGGEPDGELYYSQAQFRLVSDPYFNNDFFRSNPYAVSPDANASAAVVRQTRKTLLRVSYIKQETMSGDEFVKTYEARPRLDFNTAPFQALKLPVLNTVTASYESAQTQTTGYYLSKANARWNVDKSFYAAGWSMVPSVFYDETVLLSPYAADFQSRQSDQRIGRIGGSFSLRHNIFWGGTADLKQTFVRRFSTNTFTRDALADDRGSEMNQLSYSNFFRPSRDTYLIFSSSYDFRDLRSGARDFTDRISPFVLNFAYTPRPELTVFFNDTYAIGDGNQAFSFQADCGKVEGNRMGLGLSNYKNDPSSYIVNHTFNWFPQGRSWGVQAGLGYNIRMRGFEAESLSLYSKELTVYKTFHDFNTVWNVRLRPGVQAFNFNINLRFNTVKSRIVSEREAQRFWYPWRDQGPGATGPADANPAVQANPF
ncbi:MAG: hypothetical protein PHW69_07525 [Elusimicrobiaceae bacterium]|nr:hypothetical protein [Elusimicrobiaceae bacterium]